MGVCCKLSCVFHISNIEQGIRAPVSPLIDSYLFRLNIKPPRARSKRVVGSGCHTTSYQPCLWAVYRILCQWA